MEMTGPYMPTGLPGGRGTSSPIRRAVRSGASGAPTARSTADGVPHPGVSRVDHLTPPILHVDQLTLLRAGFSSDSQGA